MCVVSADPMASVWVLYKARPNNALRNQILEHYLPLVERAARRLSRHLPESVGIEDLIGFGVFGLIDAVESYSLDRRVRFATFSARRILGAILDELRAIDWLPRQMRSAARKAAKAEMKLRGRLGRPPTEMELSNELQLTPKQFSDLSRSVRASSFVPLDHGFRQGGAAEGPQPLPVDERAADPCREAQRGLLKGLVTNGMSRAERLIVTLYYYEELTFLEIGRVLNLSESRVSQMHTALLRRLKARFQSPGQKLSAA